MPGHRLDEIDRKILAELQQDGRMNVEANTNLKPRRDRPYCCFPDLAALVAAFKASGAKLACLCSSDKVYEKEAAEAAKALTAAGATVHLAGRPGENETNWRQAGVKTFIYMGCDVLSTLQAAHDNLAKP